MTTALIREKEKRKADKPGMVCTPAIHHSRVRGGLGPGQAGRETDQKTTQKQNLNNPTEHNTHLPIFCRHILK